MAPLVSYGEWAGELYLTRSGLAPHCDLQGELERLRVGKMHLGRLHKGRLHLERLHSELHLVGEGKGSASAEMASAQF